MVVIHDAQVDIAHLEICGKRKDHQLQDGQQENDTGQETIPLDLLKFLFQ